MPWTPVRMTPGYSENLNILPLLLYIDMHIYTSSSSYLVRRSFPREVTGRTTVHLQLHLHLQSNYIHTLGSVCNTYITGTPHLNHNITYMYMYIHSRRITASISHFGRTWRHLSGSSQYIYLCTKQVQSTLVSHHIPRGGHSYSTRRTVRDRGQDS